LAFSALRDTQRAKRAVRDRPQGGSFEPPEAAKKVAAGEYFEKKDLLHGGLFNLKAVFGLPPQYHVDKFLEKADN